MSEPLVLVERPRPGVASVVLNRPEKRNALNMALLEQLVAAMEALNADPAVRVITIRGRGGVFCAGLDLTEARDPAMSHQSAHLIAAMIRAVHGSPKITIAAVRGAAVAGGAGLMSACDLALATVESRIGYPEVRLGLVAGLVMGLLRRQVQERHVRELLLLGEIIDGERAAEMGLVTRAVPEDMLDDTLEVMLADALKTAPEAVAKSKAFLESLWRPALSEDLARALEVHVSMRSAPEALEGFAAFAEKRTPKWQG